MMVLYHLHNPTAPAFVITCNVCRLDIEAGQGWRCEICPEYDVCNACYQKDGGIDHPHKLTNHPSTADRDAQNKEARQLRVLQVIALFFNFFGCSKFFRLPFTYLLSFCHFSALSAVYGSFVSQFLCHGNLVYCVSQILNLLIVLQQYLCISP